MGSHAMLSLPNDEPDGRSSARFRVLIVATLVTTSGERIVKLRDLSTTGAMIEGDKIPPPGTDILLRRGSLELFATLIWTDGKQAGLRFDVPLTQTELWLQVNAPQFEEPCEPPPAEAPAAPFPNWGGRPVHR